MSLHLNNRNGVWYIMQAGYPDGCWLAYRDEEVARRVLEWMGFRKFDCSGIISRLYFGMLTPNDLKTIAIIQHGGQHPTQVRPKGEPVAAKMGKVKRQKLLGERAIR